MARKKAEEVATVEQPPVQESAPMTEESVNGKRTFPNPRSWAHNNDAGVELSTYSNKETKTYEAWLKFRDGKPSEEARKVMKDAGFKWHPDVPKGGNFDVSGAWTHPIGYHTGAQDRLTAERTYAEVVKTIRAEKGLPAEAVSQGVSA